MSLDGTWKPEGAELAGQHIPMPPTRLVIAGTDYRVESAEGFDRGLLRFAPEGLEVGLDIIGVSGPNAGRTIAAIWRTENDVLELCYDVGGGPRPMMFASAAGSMRLLVRYRRIG